MAVSDKSKATTAATTKKVASGTNLKGGLNKNKEKMGGVTESKAIINSSDGNVSQLDKSIVQWVQTVLFYLIFFAIIVAAVSSRLFAIIRFESIIHEFDPWFNFRATKYLVQNSFKEFLNWFDDRTWYPLGRVTGGTLYPGLMTTSAFLWHTLRKLGLPIDIRNICVLFAPAFSAITASIYL